MKRIVILCIVLFAGIGIGLRTWLGQQITQGAIFSHQYMLEHYCLQFILLAPALISGGLALILFPESAYTWLEDVIPGYGKKYTKSSYIFSIRFWGFILLAPTPIALWNTCGVAFGGIFGK